MFCLSLINRLESGLSICNGCGDDLGFSFSLVVGLSLSDEISLNYGFILGENFSFIEGVGSVNRGSSSFL